MSRRLDLCAAADVPPGTMKLVAVEDEIVLVTNLAGTYHATQGVCTHQYFELDRGFLTGESVTCALHLSRFRLRDGEPLDPPADLPLAVYAVAVDDGRVVIDVPDGALEVNR
jgi:3-phenylpropionate/trans-cinnamate dioxygenase ferredoxin subunit